MNKSPDAFRTISEVADWLGVQTHVLRFWESKFTQVKPVKRAGGRRYYRPSDMELLGGIKKLLHEDGMTIKGVQKLLREEGVGYVSSHSRPLEHELDEAEEAVAENVVRFKARPEDASDAEPATATPAAAAPTDVTAPKPTKAAPQDAGAPEKDPPETPPLPAFLTQPMGGEAPPEPPKPRIVEASDPPAHAEIPAEPGGLTRAAQARHIDPETARAISPLVGRLAVLRDRMAGASG